MAEIDIPAYDGGARLHEEAWAVSNSDETPFDNSIIKKMVIRFRKLFGTDHRLFRTDSEVRVSLNMLFVCVFGHRSLQNRESYKSLVLNVNSEEYRFVYFCVSAWTTKFIGFGIVLCVEYFLFG